MPATIKFLGGVAGENLTGSSYLLTIRQGKRTLRVLFDAGLVQCGFKDSLEYNQAILKHFDPAALDFIILSHAHIDHIGRLPLFTKHGFTGRIICTSGTKDLLITMLEDSAKIQMAEAGYLSARIQKEVAKNAVSYDKSRTSMSRGNYDRVRNRSREKSKKPVLSPLYTLADVEDVSGLIKNGGYPYGEWIRLSHGIDIKFYPSGHVMGGAVVVFQIDGKPGPTYVCFTGDLGREDGIILPPPEAVDEPIDSLIMESTYGGRNHPARDEEITKLLDIVRQAAHKKRKIIIPSFALERSQEIIYLLSYHMEKGDIPAVPIILDSPLGTKITAVFAEGWRRKMFSDQDKLGFNPFNPDENRFFRVVGTREESDKLISSTGSYIVIAGSGMCDAGRVRGHLRANLEKPDTLVCLIGYMGANSLGRRLKDGHHTVRMNKEEIVVKAEIVNFDSFSAHADGRFLAKYGCATLKQGPAYGKKIFLVHGDRTSAHDLRSDILDCLPNRRRAKVEIIIPKINQVDTLF